VALAHVWSIGSVHATFEHACSVLALLDGHPKLLLHIPRIGLGEAARDVDNGFDGASIEHANKSKAIASNTSTRSLRSLGPPPDQHEITLQAFLVAM
jgi:hypothetical protein